MMNGIKFDNVHSFLDLNLVLAPFEMPPAPVKTNYIDIPGGDGSLDLTEALGEVKYGDRKGKMTFTVLPTDDFEVKKTQISNLLNGKRCGVILDKDPNYRWTGRFTVDEYKSNKNLHQIVVGFVVAPYKLKVAETTVIVPSGTNTRTLVNGRKTAIPTIICTAQTTVEFNGNTFTFNAGTHRNVEITLLEGNNQVTVTSTGMTTFTYQEGDL